MLHIGIQRGPPLISSIEYGSMRSGPILLPERDQPTATRTLLSQIRQPTSRRLMAMRRAIPLAKGKSTWSTSRSNQIIQDGYRNPTHLWRPIIKPERRGDAKLLLTIQVLKN